MLLFLPDSQVYEAFDRKIAEQAQKLERMKEIQQSYLTEKSHMEKLIQNASDYIIRGITDYSVLQEFGLPADEGEAVTAMLKDYIEKSFSNQLPADTDACMVVNDQVIHGAAQAANAFAALQDYEDTVLLGDATIQTDQGISVENCECLWECRGWDFVYEFIDNIPPMDDPGEYIFFLRTDGK